MMICFSFVDRDCFFRDCSRPSGFKSSLKKTLSTEDFPSLEIDKLSNRQDNIRIWRGIAITFIGTSRAPVSAPGVDALAQLGVTGRAGFPAASAGGLSRRFSSAHR